MNVPLIDLTAQYRTIRPEILDALNHVLEQQQFILGPEVASLENEIAKYCGTNFAIACASGTDAILLALLTLGIGPGDEVITTSFSFFSTAGMISWVGAKPVFVDVDPATFNLRPDQVEKKITPNTKAIIAVHLFGQCCRMEELQRYGIPVIEDAAQSIGAKRNDIKAGSLGILGCFSFFPTKNLGAYGDGGLITTNDQKLADSLRQLRVHGQSSQRYLHHRIGTNSRLDELQAAVLRVKFKYLDEWNAKRAKNAQFYNHMLKGLPLDLPTADPANYHIYHQFVIRTENRDLLKTHLTNQGIGSAIYYPLPLPMQPCFESLNNSSADFPDAERISNTCLALPVYPELTPQQLELVVSAIRSFYR